MRKARKISLGLDITKETLKRIDKVSEVLLTNRTNTLRRAIFEFLLTQERILNIIPEDKQQQTKIKEQKAEMPMENSIK